MRYRRHKKFSLIKTHVVRHVYSEELLITYFISSWMIQCSSGDNQNEHLSECRWMVFYFKEFARVFVMNVVYGNNIRRSIGNFCPCDVCKSCVSLFQAQQFSREDCLLIFQEREILWKEGKSDWRLPTTMDMWAHAITDTIVASILRRKTSSFRTNIINIGRKRFGLVSFQGGTVFRRVMCCSQKSLVRHCKDALFMVFNWRTLLAWSIFSVNISPRFPEFQFQTLRALVEIIFQLAVVC